MAARDADIKLLIGVATGGPDGDSEQLIRNQLNAIMSKIKVDVTLKTTNFRSQIRKGMSEANKNGKYAVTVSDIKIGANAIKSFKQQLSAVINTLTLGKGVSVTIEHKDIGKATGEVKKLKEQTEEAVREAAELKVRMSALGSSRSAIGSGLKSISKGATTEEADRIAQLQERYRALNVSLEELKISGVKGGDARINSLEKEAAAILKVIDQIKEEQNARSEAAAQAKRENEAASYKSVKDTYSKIDTYLNKNPRIEEKYRVQLESLRKELHGIVVDVDGVDNGVTKLKKQRLTEIIDEFADLDVKITSAGQKGNTFAGMLSAAWQKFGGWMLVTKSLTTAWRTMVRMVDSVRDLDAAMTELKKVTDETSATYARFFGEATVRAKALGATLTDTITATADFARLGYSIGEAAELADAALVYKNVGDGIEDVTEASESVISTMKAFGIEAKNAMSIVDKFNEVGNNFAISSQGVGEALRRSASALAAGNNSLDESIALVTAANSVVQDADVVGTTMKTLSMYLRAAKTEAEEAGESTEGMANSVSELRSEILSLTSGRVDIMLDNDTFKSTYQIMKELAAVWDDLTDITRANILEKVAGKRNANVVSSLLENFDVAEDAVKSAADSAGSALAENEKYLDSINGKVAQFQAAFEALSAAFISSDFIKGFVSSGTDALEILTKLVDILGSFPSLLATITTAVTAFSGMKRNYLGLFDVVDGKVGVSNDAAQWAQRVKDITLYNKAVGQGKDAQANFVNSLRSTDDAMAGYLKSLNGTKATTAGYKTYCKQAGVEVKTLGVSSKLAAVGVTALNVALNAIASLAIGFVIQGIVSAITHLINADQEAIEKTKELNAAFNEFKQNNSDNISKLESMKEEFEALSIGVSQYGENISLTADEYDRYKQIVQEIVAISPELSEGYSVENGYLADKNELLERAIELQKQEYREKVHEMAGTQNIAERMGGHAVEYTDLQGKVFNNRMSFSGSIWELMNDTTQSDTIERVLKILNIPDMETVMESYKTDRGYYDWGKFWEDYADDVAYNFDKIVASVDYSELGFKSIDEFEDMVQRARAEADDYIKMQEDIAKVSKNVASELKSAAYDNDIYDGLSAEVKSIVENFVNGFGPEDIMKQTWSGAWKADEGLIEEAKAKINSFMEKLTPEVQNAMAGLFDMKGLFDTGTINVGEFESAVNAIIGDLEAAGFDDETIKSMRLSLETDQLDQQIAKVKESVSGIDDDVINSMSAEKLKFAYTIVAQDGSMTLDELQEKLEWMKYTNANMVNLTQTISELNSAYSLLATAKKEMASGDGLSAATIASLAEANADYLDYLYEENGVIKLNTEVWEENIDAKAKNEMLAIEDEITALQQENKELERKNWLLEHQPQTVDTTAQIQANSEAIAENTAKIEENQNKLAVYSTLYNGITSNLDAYSDALSGFTYVKDTIDAVSSSFTTLANLQNEVANGFTLSLDKALEFAAAYPEILDSATATADGQLMLNETVVNSFIEGKKAELTANIDQAIAELESDKEVLAAKREFAQAELELMKSVGEGEGQISAKTAEYRANASNLMTQLLIQNGMKEADAFRLAAIAMSGNADSFNEVLRDVCTDASGNFDQAAYAMAQTVYENMQNAKESVASFAAQCHEGALANAGMADGTVQGSSSVISGGQGGTFLGGFSGNTTSKRSRSSSGRIANESLASNSFSATGGGGNYLLSAPTITLHKNANFDGTNYTYTPESFTLDSLILELENQIADYDRSIANIDGQIATLQALKNTPFESFSNVAKAGSSGSKNSDKVDGEKDDVKDATQSVEEYIAAIDEYYEALKRLQEVQERRKSLEKQIEHTEDIADKINLSSKLVSAYYEEIDAQKALADAKKKTIEANVSALQGLGFEVSYNSETNRLFIKNLEHLNEITASSAGEYGSLQEATNALREDTEKLIDVTEALNDDNIEAASTIEDLGYQIQDTKNDIIDYIEEVYSKQIEAYQKIIDKRKEMIKSAKDEFDYEADIAEKVKEIADLQTRIDQLALDNSRSAQSERLSLIQELESKQKELADTQRDHSVDEQNNALDKMAEDYEEGKDAELELIRSTVNASQELWTAFYQTLLGQSVSIGDSIDVEIAGAWMRAAEAVREYSASVNGAGSAAPKEDDLQKFHDGGVVGKPNIDKDEALAILQKGEVVLNEAKQQTLYKIIDFQAELSRRLGVAIGELKAPSSSLSIRSTMRGMTRDITAGSTAQNLVFEPHIDVNITHNGSLSNKDAKAYGERIAGVAIDKLYSAFERRGISSMRGSRLKPS